MKHFNKLKRWLLIPALLVLATVAAVAQPLSGTYTVGGAAPNYPTLNAAVADLNSRGVSGPVRFNIRDGAYTEQVWIGNYPGASNANRVTIQSESGIAQNVVISFTGTGTADNYVITLGGSYVTVKNLTLRNLGATYGTAVSFVSNASHDSVHACTMGNPTAATTTSQYNSVVYAYNLGGINNTVSNDSIINGGYGLYVYGYNQYNYVNEFNIVGNKIRSPYYMGMYLYNTSNIKVKDNIFHGASAYTSTNYGIYMYYSYNAYEISGNTFNVTALGAHTTIQAYYGYGDANNTALRGKIINNTMNLSSTTVALTPINCSIQNYLTISGNIINATTTSGAINNYFINGSSNGFTVTNNTVNAASSTSGSVYGMYIVPSSGFYLGSIRNNKISATSGSGSVWGLYTQYLFNVDVVNNTAVVATSGTNNGALAAWYNTNSNFYNNTFHSNATGATNYAGYIYNSAAPNMSNVYNNVFSKTATTGAAFYNYNSNFTRCDYNNYYTAAGTGVVQRGTPAIAANANLQTWRTSTLQDMNSLNYDPGFTSTTNLVPDAANASSWSLNGRGVHVAGNNLDINGNTRSVSPTTGVPDIGAYEFTPSATPPAATATPAAPALNGTQVFTFGQDTVATFVWPNAAPIPASVTVRQYTGTVPPTINTLSSTNMYFYTDVSVPAGTYAHTSNIYYKDPWVGNTATEAGLRLASKDGANPWVATAPPASTTNATRNIITTTGLNTLGLFTGIDGSLNAGVVAITNPTTPFCQGTVPVTVTVKNFGSTAINNVTINWSLDGTAQASVPYATTIAPGGTASVVLGNVIFGTTARTIRTWTSLPNGTADAVAGDDSTNATFRASLNGIYTVGGTTPSYATLQAAVTDLNTLGVCGPVTFNVRTGTYAATQVIVNRVKGGSAVNRVTFQSETGNPADVTISFTGTSVNPGGNNYVFKLDSASYISIKNMTLHNTATATYAGKIVMTWDASYDSVVNCRFTTAVTAVGTTATSAASIYASPFVGTDNVFQGNTFTNGGYGIYIYGVNQGIVHNRNIIQNNTFTTQTYMSVYNYFGDNIKIRNNTFTASGALTSGYYGIYNLYANGDVDVSSNNMTITTTSTGTLYGVYSLYTFGAPGNPNLSPKFNRNRLTMTNANTATMYGLLVNNSAYDSIVGNNITATSTSTGALYPLVNTSNSNCYVAYDTVNATTNGSAYTSTLNTCANSRAEYLNIRQSTGSTGSNYHYGVYYANGSSLTNSSFRFLTNTTSSAYPLYNYGLAYCNGGTYQNNNVWITGSAYYHYNYTGYSCADGLIDNNVINDTNTYTTGYVYGLMAYGGGTANRSLANMTISNNKITTNSYFVNYGLYYYYPYRAKIFNNVVKARSSNSDCYGMYCYYPVGNNLIYNNAVSARGSYTMGLYYIYDADGQSNLLNNTFNIASTGTGYCLYAPGTTTYSGKAYFYNNVFSCQSMSSGYLLYLASNPNYFFDHNAYYTAGGSFVYYPTVAGNGLGVRRAYGQDMNSVYYDMTTAYTDAVNGNLAPNTSNAGVWAMNGRGNHFPTIINSDVVGNTRPTVRQQGVVDIGAYQFQPAVNPPNCTATPAAPAAGGTQVFTFGEDTVASIKWDATNFPPSIQVRQWPGEAPPSYFNPQFMFTHTDFIVPPPAANYPHEVNLYYKDPQRGTTGGETSLRMIQDSNRNGNWYSFNPPTTPPGPVGSSTDPVRNIINAYGVKGFGYHSATDVSNNAGVTRLVEPSEYFCAPATRDIKIKVQNLGNNTINNIRIGYTINGGPATVINYTAPPAIGTAVNPPDSIIVTLTNYNFATSQPVRIVAYTFLPNGLADPVTADDTLKATIYPGLSGTYYVGNAPLPAPPADFATVQEAIDVVNAWGICGPVTFKVRDGVYNNTAGVINAPIRGGSVVNRVTFEGESGVANAVVVNAVGTNPALTLNNVTDVTFRSMRIVSPGTTTISLGGAPNRDSFLKCNIVAGTTTSTTTTLAVISGLNTTWDGNNIVFMNDSISGATAAFYLYSRNVATSGVGIVIDSNVFTGSYYYGVGYLYNLRSLKFRRNTTRLQNNTVYHTYIYNAMTQGTDPIEITGNTFNLASGSMYTYMSNIIGTAATPAKVENNKWLVAGTSTTSYLNTYIGYYYTYCNVRNNEVIGTTGYGYAMYPYYANNTKFYNNVVNMDFTYASLYGYGIYNYYPQACSVYNNTYTIKSAYSTSYCAYFNAPSGYNNNVTYNNIFLNLGTSGQAYYWSNAGTNNNSDYNTIFSANGQHFTTGTVDTSLHNWRLNRGIEKNSIVYNPGLGTDSRPDGTNPGVWAINGRALQMLGNNVDKDGNPRIEDRTLGVPDVGAYEVEPSSVPPLAKANPAVSLASTTQTFTFGQDTVATITWNPGRLVPTYTEVRCYSGRKAPNNFPSTANYMYFYSDINTQNISYDFNPTIYYKNIWLGTIANENNLRIAKQLNPGPWVAYNTPLSSVSAVNDKLTGSNFTSTGYFTGIEDGVLFSAIITPSGSTVFCPGGSVQLNANTGVGYTYQWFRNGTAPGDAIPSATGPSYIATQTGDYYVVITSGPTTATSGKVAVTIVAPPSANITASGPLTYCTGGQLSLMANTGLGLTYQWQFNGNDIPAPTGTMQTLPVTGAGNYTVSVRNIGCATTSSIVPVTSGPLTVSLGNDTSFCQSTPLILDAGYPGAKYTWSTGDTTQSITLYNYTGDISVFVDAGVNCQDRDTIAIHTDPLPTVLGISSTFVNGSTFTMTPSGDQNASSYMWIHGDGGVDFTKNVTHTYNPGAPSAWTVLLVVFNDCGTDTTFLDLRTTINVKDVDENAQFTLYPNPATDHVTLSVAGKLTLSEVTVINHLGQVLYRGTSEGVKAEKIDVSTFANGHYIIRANTSDGKIISKPFDIVR
jgi:hypothetical protein